MQTTRSQILELLKKKGKATVEELAAATEVTSAAIRHQLAILERDALVASEEVHGALGRPRYLYRLTQRGDDLFLKNYFGLSRLILEEFQELPGEDLLKQDADGKLGLLFERIGNRLVRENLDRVRGRSLEERIAEVVNILKEDGNIPEWHKTDYGFKILDYNCPYHRLAQTAPQICDMRLNFLTRMLQAEVARENHANSDSPCCVYKVQERNVVYFMS